MPLEDRVEIVPGLWQGSIVLPGDPVRRAGFDALAICAEEYADHPDYAPDLNPFPGVRVFYNGIDDAVLSKKEALQMERAAEDLSHLHRRGENLLIVCRLGKNRSGLCSALTLVHRFRCTGREAYHRVVAQRPKALRNPSFERYLINR